MVNLEYVNKRKRRKAASIVSAVGSVILTTFIIISFLGQKIGTFTIKLLNSDVELALSRSSNFTEENQTTFLRVDDLERMEPYCYQNFRNLDGNLDFSEIDNEATEYNMGVNINKKTQEVISWNYFKYTFFIKNVGVSTAHYDMDIKIISNSMDTRTQKKLDSFLRMALFIDGEYTVYAKRSDDATHYDPENPEEKTSLEYLDCNPEKNIKHYEGFAHEFESENTIASIERRKFESEDIVRYTLLFWLEGDDNEAKGIAPKECKLRLGVEIQAYEN